MTRQSEFAAVVEGLPLDSLTELLRIALQMLIAQGGATDEDRALLAEISPATPRPFIAATDRMF